MPRPNHARRGECCRLGKLIIAKSASLRSGLAIIRSLSHGVYQKGMPRLLVQHDLVQLLDRLGIIGSARFGGNSSGITQMDY